MPYIEGLVSGSFDEFIRRNILQYKMAQQLPVSFTGSVACVFRPQLERLLLQNGLTAGEVYAGPHAGVDYISPGQILNFRFHLRENKI